MDAVTGLKTFAFGVTMVLTIFLNGIVLLTFHADKRRRLSTKCINVFITNLAVCQLLIGLIVMPFVQLSIVYDAWKSQSILCQLNGFATSVCFYTSVLMLCVISLDRYVAIVMATRYQKLLTRKKGVIIVICIWSLSSLLSLPPLIGWSGYEYHPGTYHCSPLWIGKCGYFYFTFTISVMIPTSFTIFSYSVIFWKVRKHRKRISLWKNGGHSVHTSNNNTEPEVQSRTEMNQIVSVNPEPRFSKTPTVGLSPVTTRKSATPVLPPKATSQFLAMPGNEFPLEQAEIENPGQKDGRLMTSTEKTGHKGMRLSRSTSGQSLISDDNSDLVQDACATDQSLKRTVLESQPIVYHQNQSTAVQSIQSDVMNIKVREFQSNTVHDNRESSSLSQETKPDLMHTTDNVLQGKDCIPQLITRQVEASVSQPDNVTSENESIATVVSMKSKKANKSRSHDLKNFRLTEEDENELLNISKDSQSDNEAASAAGGGFESAGTSGDEGTRSTVTRKNQKMQKGKRNSIFVIAKTLTSRKGADSRKQSKARARRASKLRASHTLREFKVAKTGAILLTFFMMCFGPYTIVHLCHLPFHVPLWAQHIAMWCVFFNSILSPLIYGFMNKDTRVKIKELLCRCK